MKLQQKINPYKIRWDKKGDPEAIAHNKKLLKQRQNKWNLINRYDVKRKLDTVLQEIKKEEAEKFLNEYIEIPVYGVNSSGEYVYIEDDTDIEHYKMFGIL